MTKTSFNAESPNGQKIEIVIENSDAGIIVKVHDEILLTLGYQTETGEKLCLTIYEKRLNNYDLLLL
jgi:hypothetical protein